MIKRLWVVIGLLLGLTVSYGQVEQECEYTRDEAINKIQQVEYGSDLKETIQKLCPKLKGNIEVVIALLNKIGYDDRFFQYDEFLRNAHPVVQSNYDIAKFVVTNDKKAISHAYPNIEEHYETVQSDIDKESDEYKQAAQKLTEYKELVLITIENNSGNFNLINNKIKGVLMKDTEFADNAIWTNPFMVRYFDEHRSNPVLMTALIQQHSKVLKYASDDIKSNYNIVKAAVTNDPEVIEYAYPNIEEHYETVQSDIDKESDEYKQAKQKLTKYKELVLIAIDNVSGNFNLINNKIKGVLMKDTEFANKAILANAFMVRYFDEHRSNPVLMTMLIQQHGEVLQYASDEIKSNFDSVKIAITKNNEAIKYAYPNIEKHYETVQSAIDKKSDEFKKANQKLTEYRELVINALTQSNAIFDNMDREVINALFNDTAFVRQVISVKPDVILYYYEIRNNHDFMKNFISEDPNLLRYATDDNTIRQNYDVIKKAVSNNGELIQYAHSSLQENPEIQKIALLTYPEAINYANSDMKKQLLSKDWERYKDAINVTEIESKDVALVIVTKDSSNFYLLPPNIKNNEDVLLTALNSGNSKVWNNSDLDPEFKKDMRKKESVMRALINSRPSYLYEASKELIYNHDFILSVWDPFEDNIDNNSEHYNDYKIQQALLATLHECHISYSWPIIKKGCINLNYMLYYYLYQN
jgi:hypothetical protein